MQSFGNPGQFICGAINSGGNSNSNSGVVIFDGVAWAVFAVTSNKAAVALANKLY